MTHPRKKSFTHSHEVLVDGAVSFKCSGDTDIWPWLTLAPFDPIVVQTINYWTSVETGIARGTWDPTKWSALTQTEWTCGAAGVSHATHGVADSKMDESDPRYQLTFFDKNGSLVYRMSGTGVIFKNRDFETWRNKAKRAIEKPAALMDFPYASAARTGLEEQAHCFISELIDQDNRVAHGLITKDNGFPPGHPYLSGSGDHVNSTHLATIARQFVNLMLDGASPDIVGGHMSFHRYVELDIPFQVQYVPTKKAGNHMSLTVSQADHLCATLALEYRS
ncbi:MAG: hypothetical protein ABJO01_12675 [Parasphingorhabdus sp.]|uniref:hypothetical protein n=1 Tax=Parasphingorhabdus sp. TaxID=2709688 RepID=UPI00329A78F6